MNVHAKCARKGNATHPGLPATLPPTHTLTWRVRLPQHAAAQEHQQLVGQPQALPPLQQGSWGGCLCWAPRLLSARCLLCISSGSSRHQQQGGGGLVVEQRAGEDGDQCGKEAVPNAQRDELRAGGAGVVRSV